MSEEKAYLDDFVIEAADLLDEAEDSLLAADKNSDTKACFDIVFRAFHSLKGSAGMLGLDNLQKHLHKLEDNLQKSKNDSNKFRSNIDYYLKGIDASRKYLNHEEVNFVYEEMAPATKKTLTIAPSSEIEQKVAPTVSANKIVADKKRKIVLYLCRTNENPVCESMMRLKDKLNCDLKFIKEEDLADIKLVNEEYDILVSDLDEKILEKIIPQKKSKFPLILMSEQVEPPSGSLKVFQVLKKSDELVRIQMTLQSALDARDNLELFEISKDLIMFMYSDLEHYLVHEKKIPNQIALKSDVQNFVKKFKR